MRKALMLGCALLVFASLATAQAPSRGNVFVGYSYYNADWFSAGRANLNGWTGSLEGRIVPHVGLVADFSQTFGTQTIQFDCPGIGCPLTENVNAHEYNLLFGPRVSFSTGKLRPFAEALFGVGHLDGNGQGIRPLSGSTTSFAMALGGGVDYRIIRPIALRLEGDYIQTHFFSANASSQFVRQTQNNARLSAGIVFRF
jgi:opacity protein-like surface antigen